jgi:hypothetical protein
MISVLKYTKLFGSVTKYNKLQNRKQGAKENKIDIYKISRWKTFTTKYKEHIRNIQGLSEKFMDWQQCVAFMPSCSGEGNVVVV